MKLKKIKIKEIILNLLLLIYKLEIWLLLYLRVKKLNKFNSKFKIFIIKGS
jgi:hypothetical protein